MDWMPTLKDRSGPAYLRIVEALTEDIASGRLRRGQHLPTHRELARSLGLDLTTITRAYAEAKKRGLTIARVGQGTFVAESRLQAIPEPITPAFDLSMNLPPQPADADIEGRITRGIGAIQREGGLAACLNYLEPGGSPDERTRVAEWLRPRLPHAEADRVLITPGTQNALLSILLTLTSPGDVILTEPLTYPGLKAVAEIARLNLVGVTTDALGPLPDALSTAIRKHRPKALYLVPTIHNPTTVTVPLRRRKAIADVLERSGVPIIEDDAYGLLDPSAVPFAALIPHLAFTAVSLSKCVSPGLRLSLLQVPNAEAAVRVSEGVRASAQMTTGLMLTLALRWIADESINEIITSVRTEAAERQKLAAKALTGHAYKAHPQGHHMWLQLPLPWNRFDFAVHVHRLGIGVVTSDAFAVTEPAPNAIRVALGAAKSRQELFSALDVLAACLRSGGSGNRVI